MWSCSHRDFFLTLTHITLDGCSRWTSKRKRDARRVDQINEKDSLLKCWRLQSIHYTSIGEADYWNIILARCCRSPYALIRNSLLELGNKLIHIDVIISSECWNFRISEFNLIISQNGLKRFFIRMNQWRFVAFTILYCGDNNNNYNLHHLHYFARGSSYMNTNEIVQLITYFYWDSFQNIASISIKIRFQCRKGAIVQIYIFI